MVPRTLDPVAPSLLLAGNTHPDGRSRRWRLWAPGAWALWAGWFLLGLVAGVGLARPGSPPVPPDLPPRHCEATVYLPLADNHGRKIPDDEWQRALDLLVADLGGATLQAPLEGCWRDGRGHLCREPMRPVAVTFERRRLDDFRRTVRQVGRHLGQEVLYVRFTEPRVELLPVPTAAPEQGP
jgi:hypothetical protein